MVFWAISHHHLGLVQSGLLNGDARGGGGFLVVEVLLGLVLAVIGGVERQDVLTRDDSGQEGVLADFEFGQLDVGGGGFHLIAGLLVQGLAVGLRP